MITIAFFSLLFCLSSASEKAQTLDGAIDVLPVNEEISRRFGDEEEQSWLKDGRHDSQNQGPGPKRLGAEQAGQTYDLGRGDGLEKGKWRDGQDMTRPLTSGKT